MHPVIHIINTNVNELVESVYLILKWSRLNVVRMCVGMGRGSSMKTMYEMDEKEIKIACEHWLRQRVGLDNTNIIQVALAIDTETPVVAKLVVIPSSVVKD